MFGLAALFASSAAGWAATAKPDCPDQLTFLSDKPGIYKTLEQHQRAIYDKNPGILDPLQREVLRDPKKVVEGDHLSDQILMKLCQVSAEMCVAAKKAIAEAKRMALCTPLPTRYETPLDYGLLKLALDPVDAIRRRDYPMSREVRFITLPTGASDGEGERLTGGDGITGKRD